MALYVLPPNFFVEMQKHEKRNNLSILNIFTVSLACKKTQRRWFQEGAWYLQFLASNYAIGLVLSESSIKKNQEEEMIGQKQAFKSKKGIMTL